MTELENLEIEEVSKLATSDISTLKKQLKQKENLSINDLKALKKAEKAGQDREQALNFIDKQINAEKIAVHLGVAESDLKELDKTLDKIRELEHVETFEDPNIQIDQEKLLELVGGTVKEIKEFVDENQLTDRQLQDILEAERKVKNRVTAKKFLKQEIRNAEISEETTEMEKHIDILEEKLNELENTEEKSLELEEEDLETAIKNLHDQTDEQDEDEKEKDESPENGENEEDPDKNDQEDQDETKSEDSEDDTDGSSSESGEEEDQESDLERKRELADELGLDLSDEELENYSVEKLETTLEEKQTREKIISELEEKGEFEEEQLRNASTSDLKKLKEQLNGSSEGEDEDKEEDQVKEEAEEDLQMLMGASKSKGNSSKDEHRTSKIKKRVGELANHLHGTFERSTEEDNDSNRIKEKELLQVLDKYEKIGGEEAAVKSAHVTKAYLEQELGIKKELTYKQLAEEIPKDNKEMQKVADFFKELSQKQYRDGFSAGNGSEYVDLCRKAVKSV